MGTGPVCCGFAIGHDEHTVFLETHHVRPRVHEQTPGALKSLPGMVMRCLSQAGLPKIRNVHVSLWERVHLLPIGSKRIFMSKD